MHRQNLASSSQILNVCRDILMHFQGFDAIKQITVGREVDFKSNGHHKVVSQTE